MKSLFLSLVLCVFVSASASALQKPVPLSTDFRLREVPYSPHEVYKFTGHFGYQSSIEFEQGEDIKTISVGDSVAWQIVAAGNRLFLKPVEANPDTNMTVVTNRRVYHFILIGKEASGFADKDMTFVLRFQYPGSSNVQIVEAKESPSFEFANNPGAYNTNYSISGSQRISPIRIFDDGEFTYFQFRDINADIPAFFKVDSEGRESIVNFRTVGDYIVVERVTSQFTLRHGIDVVCVFNERMPLELSPELAEEKANR